MAWNKYYIFVKSPVLTHINAILSQLQLTAYKPVKEVPLNFSNKPETLFTGFYNGNLLIVHPDLPFHFFGEEQSETERLFIETFPDSEIAALIENSTVGLYSYAIIEKGKRVRMKDGCDGEVYNDKGELLAEERAIFSTQIFPEEEIDEMREGGMDEEEIMAMIQHEACWRVPNLLTKRYLGEPVREMDTDKVILTMYEK
jgi:hypothetical protein